MKTVLVLNQDYSPLSTCSVERAFLLIYLEKADLLSENKKRFLRTIRHEFPWPSVIRIRNYAHIPYKGVVLTRINVLRRDNHTCQYCGTKKDLTLDHLVPKSKGGTTTWANLVTACRRCNARKGNDSPERAGMTLNNKPYRPSYASFLLATVKEVRTDWLIYLEPKARLQS